MSELKKIILSENEFTSVLNALTEYKHEFTELFDFQTAKKIDNIIYKVKKQLEMEDHYRKIQDQIREVVQ